jgi:RNA polymerase sigma-70 factor (ECF subfamily)
LLEKCSDNELYDLFLKGRQEAMGIIVQRNSPKLFNFVYRMVPDPATCEELVQEVFLKLVRARPDFSSGTKVSTYMFSVARNLAIDEIRKQKHRRHMSLDQAVGNDDCRTLKDKLSDGKAGTDCGAISSELREKIEQSVALLPPEQKEVFCMREIEGLGFAQIARILDCSENTAKSRMRYALEKLRSHLKEIL